VSFCTLKLDYSEDGEKRPTALRASHADDNEDTIDFGIIENE
jgi:hypothetical protein